MCAGPILLIGDLDATRRLCAHLEADEREVVHLPSPSEEDLRQTFGSQIAAVAVVVRGDAVALRYALLVEHLSPGIPLVVTVFDRTVASQLQTTLPNCVATSPADIAVPRLVAECLRGSAGVRWPRWRTPIALARLLCARLRIHDTSSRLLLTGLSGLTVVLAIDWIARAGTLGAGVASGFLDAARTVATVGSESSGRLPGWYEIASGVSVLLTIGFTGLFTAGLVTRSSSLRVAGIVGQRVPPTRDHVIVAGLGQIGLRLCLALRDRRVAVVAVERDPSAPNLRLARVANIPVVIAHAEDRYLLRQLRVDRAVAVAAMGVDELENIEIAVSALAESPNARVVLRAGENDVIAETRSMFGIGAVCDVPALTARAVAKALLRNHERVESDDGTGLATSPIARCQCSRMPQAGR